MPNLVNTKEEIVLTKQVKSISQTYQEIASMRMSKIREDVILTRDFLKRLNEVYFEVKINYKREIEKLKRVSTFRRLFVSKKMAENLASFATFSQNGKTLSVLLTSNDRLIGNITRKVINEFYSATEKKDSDVLIIGKMGKRFFEAESSKKFSYFDYPAKEDLDFYKKLIAIFVKYQKVDVYFGKFLNLVNQTPEKVDITAEEQPDADVYQKKVPYLFEPSLKEVLKFFEEQICFSLVKQSFNESNLAHLGSQMHAMEITAQNSEIILKKLITERIRLEKQEKNKKTYTLLSGLSLWGN